MSRRLASPEAETASYWPVRIRVTISSEEPPYFAFTLQPVLLVNGLTHCGCVYPSQTTRFNEPSPLPIFVIIDGVELALTPDAGTHNAAATAASATCLLRIRLILPLPVRFRMCARAATRGGPGCLGTR